MFTSTSPFRMLATTSRDSCRRLLEGFYFLVQDEYKNRNMYEKKKARIEIKEKMKIIKVLSNVNGVQFLNLNFILSDVTFKPSRNLTIYLSILISDLSIPLLFLHYSHKSFSRRLSKNSINKTVFDKYIPEHVDVLMNSRLDHNLTSSSSKRADSTDSFFRFLTIHSYHRSLLAGLLDGILYLHRAYE